MTVLRSQVSAAGSLGAVVFALGYATLTLAPVPKNALSVGAGLLFGFASGLLVVWSGAMLGALAAFGLARGWGRGAARVQAGRRARVEQLLRRNGMAGVLALRLVPVMPFTVVNYGSGLSAVKPRDYALGTGLGIVPGTAFYVWVGAAGGMPSRLAIVTGTVLVALALGLAVIRR